MKCSVCYTTKKLVYTACNHTFCDNCIKNWLQIKHNCPVCRRSVWGFKKYKKEINKKEINKKEINKKPPFVRSIPPKTRSGTQLQRWNDFMTYIDNQTFLLQQTINNIHAKILIIEKIFKKMIQNSFLIKQMDNNTHYINTIAQLLNQLENSDTVKENNYLDKIKLWKYKLINC